MVFEVHPKIDLPFTLGALPLTALAVNGVDPQPNPFLTMGGIDHTASEPNMGLCFVSRAKIGTSLQMSYPHYCILIILKWLKFQNWKIVDPEEK